MVEVTANQLQKLAYLFEGWEETLIWSVLQGCMGKAWADHIEQPKAALLWLGDFLFWVAMPNVRARKNWLGTYLKVFPEKKRSSCPRTTYGNTW